MNNTDNKSKVSFLSFAKKAIDKYVTNPNEKYIKWGSENSLPFEYLKLYNEVPEHTSSIDFTTNTTIGDGLNSDKLDYWLSKKIVNDYNIFGGYAIEVIKTRNGKNSLSYCDISKCRYNLDKTKIGYSEEWDKYTKDIIWKNISKDSTEEGIFIYKSNICRDLYPVPYYNSLSKSLSTMSYIIDYHNNNAANGFSPSVVVNFNNGIPDDEVQRKIENGLKEKFTGERGQKFILSFNESAETKTTIEHLTTDNLDEKFETLQKFIQNQIIVSHKITSGSLIGVKADNQGFSKTEFQEALDIFKEITINGIRKELEYSFKLLTGEDILFTDKLIIKTE